MAGMMAETYMLYALSNGFSAIKDPATASKTLPDILSALNANELNAAIQWFTDPNKPVIIAPGFPSDPAQLPFIGVTVANDGQKAEETGIGLAYYRRDNSDGTKSDVRGLRFAGNIKATIYTPDANLIIWLSCVCKWALMTNYDYFNDEGLNNVQIGLGDYEPSPEFLPIFSFARGIFLTADYDCTFTQVPTGGTSVKVTPTFNVLSD